MGPRWLNIHPEFRLNGIHYTGKYLWEIGYSLIKEGEPFEVSIGEFLMDWRSSNDELSVLTSGSTGYPKRIGIKKEWMLNSAKATGAYFHLEAGNKALLCLPCSSIAGKMMLVRAMFLGLHLDYVEPAASPLWATQKKYDFVAMVPMQVQNSLEHLAKVKKLIIGGAPINTLLKRQLKVVNTQVFETYGMTETVSHIAVKNLKQEEDWFHLIPDITISQDERECLVVHAPHLSNVIVKTNDIVEIVDENHFKWLGRYDSVVNSGGVKLIPEQIEQKLEKLIDARFFVAGIADHTLGQRLVLLVEDKKRDVEELLEQIRTLDNLDKYEIPKAIFLVEQFMETATGKIQRDKTLSLIG